ncbi:hypothetical protein FHS28_004189 [Roseateles terrae]|uniref:Uncharacterized protein n=1 Tax=Roseateles terrae TaxID=431060 RepID=A0ABR6GYP6_9BURK|nr:hypothetical protein [Roseateles terrae]MBB3196767.1 hypothetical protein [Roseateles terrae]
MAVSEEEGDVEAGDVMKAGHQDHDLLVSAPLNAAPPGVDVAKHGRERGEIERDVVVQIAARWQRHLVVRPLVDEFLVTDGNPGGGLRLRVAAVQTVIQHPSEIVSVDDSPDECLLRVEAGVNHGAVVLIVQVGVARC